MHPSAHLSVWVHNNGIQRRSCSPGTLQTYVFYSRTKPKRVTNGCRTWRLCFSLAMQFANNMLLFNGVNQISANGMKGKTLQKSWQSRKNRMTDWAFRIKQLGASELLMAGDGSNRFHNMTKWSDVCCLGKRETIAYFFIMGIILGTLGSFLFPRGFIWSFCFGSFRKKGGNPKELNPKLSDFTWPWIYLNISRISYCF